jgi:hypothetical protein
MLCNGMHNGCMSITGALRVGHRDSAVKSEGCRVLPALERRSAVSTLFLSWIFLFVLLLSFASTSSIASALIPKLSEQAFCFCTEIVWTSKLNRFYIIFVPKLSEQVLCSYTEIIRTSKLNRFCIILVPKLSTYRVQHLGKRWMPICLICMQGNVYLYLYYFSNLEGGVIGCCMKLSLY